MDLRGRLSGAETYQRRALAEVRWLVIHHSAVAVDSSAREIADYHARVLGWPGIGYHFVVHWDGAIDYCGDMETIRYHVAGRNRECLGICLPGDWTRQHPPAPQLASTRELLAWLRTLIPSAQIVGHRDVALPGYPSACPGATWPEWRAALTG